MINAAIVGLGTWGQTLVNAVQGKSDLIRFVAGATRTPSKVEGFASRHGFPVHADYQAVLDDKGVDAVVLATLHSQHSAQVIAGARAGKHVMVEKPFTLTKASAEAAVEACNEAGVVMAVAQNRRFLLATIELKRLIETGELGTILHVEGNISGPSGHYYKPDLWRVLEAESPVGNMGAMGVHMLDEMINLLGPIADVYVRSLRRAIKVEMDDTSSALFTFVGGYTGYLATMATTARIWRLFVWGSKAMAEMRGQNDLFIYRIEDPRAQAEPEHIGFPPTDIELAELEGFAEAITGKAPYAVPTEEAIHGAAVLEAMTRACETGEAVPVP